MAIVATVTMGVTRPVLAKLCTLMGGEYKKLRGVETEVSFLEKELRAMHKLLVNMDDTGELDPQAKAWRKDLIDMSYAIEDCIDDFMDRIGEASHKVGILKKATHFVRTFKDRYRKADEIKKIKNLVIEASKRRKSYMVDFTPSNASVVRVDPRLSAIYKDPSCLVGIESQKDELVKWVKDDAQQLKVMSIVGFGGSGKTTLANQVFQEVKGQFNCSGLVSVSQKPHITSLLNSLLLQLRLDQYSEACTQEILIINKLREHLQDKRYFIVIDDLWGISTWENVISFIFPENNHHSRVMITTRNKDVARKCYNNKASIHNMKPLSEQDSRKLFFTRIFGSEDACPSQFTELSRDILKKCGGLPVAINTVASILACQNHVILKEHWQEHTKLKKLWVHIQKCLATNFGEEFALESMMNILDLSYKSLPHHLKACFLYLGSYPEDHRISKFELVTRWVAEGFLSCSDKQDVWDAAEIYFNELVNRSMIQPVYAHYSTEVLRCTVHDMMLDFIISKCKEYNFIRVLHDLQDMGEMQDKVRRLSVKLNGSEDVKMPVATSNHLSNIRCLAIYGGSKWVSHLGDLKYLRVIFLEFPEHATEMDVTSIIHLSQLKYLKIEKNFWDPDKLKCSIILPDKFRQLRHLQTLEILYVSVSNIPSDIVDLSCLSHLVLESHSAKKLPEGIGKMKSLRTLEGFSPSTSSLESTKGISELTNLEQLRLDCEKDETGCVTTWMATLSSSLEKLSNLQRLSLGSLRSSFCADAMMSSFSPPSKKIEKLDLEALTFSRVPGWISALPSLCSLSLRVKKMPSADMVGIIGKLEFLTYLLLEIPGVLNERILVPGIPGLFKLLKCLHFFCDGPSCLIFEEGAMPKLQKLQLVVNPLKWDKATPVGLEHLSSLNEIQVNSKLSMSKLNTPGFSGPTTNDEDEAGPLWKVFQEAADVLPSYPKFKKSFTYSSDEEYKCRL